MALQLDTSLYQTNPIDLATPVQAGLNAYEQVSRVRNANAARNAAEREAKAKDEADFLAHQDKLHEYMNSVKGEVARYVKAYPEEKRPEIWKTRAKQSLAEAGLDVTDMPDYDPAELEAWDLNSSGENVRSRNQIAEQKDLTSRYSTDQNNMTKLALMQLKGQNPALKYIRGNDGYMYSFNPNTKERLNTGIPFDQSRSFLTQDNAGAYNIVNFNPQAPFMPAQGVPPQGVPPQGEQPPYPEVDQSQELPPAPVPQVAPIQPSAVTTTSTGITKGKPIPQDVQNHIANAVEQSQTLDEIASEIEAYADSHKAGKRNLLQKIVKPTGFVAGAIDKLAPLNMGPAINNEINPDSAELRGLLGRLEALTLKDLSGTAVNMNEVRRSAKWIPGVGDPDVHSIGPKIRKMQEFFNRKLGISAKQYSPEFGFAPSPLLEPFLGDYDAGLRSKQAELSAAQAKLKALQATSAAPADTGNIASLSGTRPPSHLGKVTSLPPGGFSEGDTQDNVDENGNPVVLIFTNGKWQVK